MNRCSRAMLNAITRSSRTVSSNTLKSFPPCIPRYTPSYTPRHNSLGQQSARQVCSSHPSISTKHFSTSLPSQPTKSIPPTPLRPANISIQRNPHPLASQPQTPSLAFHRLLIRNLTTSSRFLSTQRRALSTTTPPPTTTTAGQSLDELSKMPTNVVPIPKPKLKFRWGLRFAQFVVFIFGFTAAATTAFFYRCQIMASFFDALTKFRLWSGGIQDLKSLATPQYLSQDLPIAFTGDLDSDIYSLQQIWFHHTFLIRHLMQKIVNQINRISDTYTHQLAGGLRQQSDHIMNAAMKPGDLQYDTFALLMADLQELLNNSQLTYGEILEFSVILSSTDADFAIDPRKWTHPSAETEKKQLLEHLEYSIHEAVVYIDRMHELLATVTEQGLRLQRLQDFITDISSYPAYREELIAIDNARRIKYDEQMAEIERQLLQLQQQQQQQQQPPQPGQVNNNVLNLDDPEVRKEIETKANHAKSPPALHLDIAQIEQEERR